MSTVHCNFSYFHPALWECCKKKLFSVLWNNLRKHRENIQNNEVNQIFMNPLFLWECVISYEMVCMRIYRNSLTIFMTYDFCHLFVKLTFVRTTRIYCMSICFQYTFRCLKVGHVIFLHCTHIFQFLGRFSRCRLL